MKDYVSTQLNKPQNLGRVHQTLKMREGASNNTYTKGETMEDGYRTLVTESEKASALNRTYATVSKQVHDK